MRIRIRIQQLKLMRIHADPDTDPDPKPCVVVYLYSTGIVEVSILYLRLNKKWRCQINHECMYCIPTVYHYGTTIPGYLFFIRRHFLLTKDEAR